MLLDRALVMVERERHSRVTQLGAVYDSSTGTQNRARRARIENNVRHDDLR